MPSPSTSAARPDVESIEEAKTALREKTREARARRSLKRRAEAADAIAMHLLALPEVQAARCVSIYCSRPSEPGTLPAIEALAQRGVRVLVPMLGDGLQRCWGEYRGADDLTQRAPGRPPEPSGDALPASALADADVVVTTALAVDPTGIRLGQGGGWYDRVLASARPDALLVAVVFPEEVRRDGTPVPREDHDVPIHAVVTPEGVTRFAR